jgi:hypothetical protein
MLSFIFDFKRKEEVKDKTFMYSTEQMQAMSDSQFQCIVDWSLGSEPSSSLFVKERDTKMLSFLDRVIAEMKRRA